MRTLCSWLVLGLVLANNALAQDQGNSIAGELGDDECECVPYYLCENGTIVTDGKNLIDIRISDDCTSSIDLCCKKPNMIPEDEYTHPTPSPLASTGCGQRNPKGVGFTITGDKDGEAQFGEFPWMVALLKEEAVDGTDQRVNIYQCGGSLIHPQVVLTAAHCVANKSPDELKIRAGEWDTQTKNELFQHQDRIVSAVIIHEGFTAGSLFNDIALLILQDPVTIAENVGTVCLPIQGENFDHRRCFASGWGKDVFGKEGKYQVILKKIELPVVPRAACQNALRKTRLGRYFTLHESFTCAGGEANRDTCKGDGGSPLACPMANDPLHYKQAGIVAWGIGCGEDATPGVYVNVAQFRKWIDSKMIANNFGTESYSS